MTTERGFSNTAAKVTKEAEERAKKKPAHGDKFTSDGEGTAFFDKNGKKIDIGTKDSKGASGGNTTTKKK